MLLLLLILLGIAGHLFLSIVRCNVLSTLKVECVCGSSLPAVSRTPRTDRSSQTTSMQAFITINYNFMCDTGAAAAAERQPGEGTEVRPQAVRAASASRRGGAQSVCTERGAAVPPGMYVVDVFYINTYGAVATQSLRFVSHHHQLRTAQTDDMLRTRSPRTAPSIHLANMR